ncbi:MAG: FAD-dependent monooxygenase [Streptosporangiaceae bacterium]
MTTKDESTPVLIVGGSLVGLSAAVFLAWRGVPTVVVEKHAGSSTHPRAIGYTTRTLELFRAVGINLPKSHHSGAPRRARVESLAGTWYEEYPWTPPSDGKPTVEYSPVAGTAIAQDRLEPLMRERAIGLGADLRPNTELVGFTQDDDAVTATLRERGGRDYRLRAQYLVAADGARSFVREELGIERSGQGLLSVQRSILFRAPLKHYLEHGIVQFEIEQPEFKAFLTTYSDGRWVLMVSDDVDRDADEQRALVQRAIGRSDLPIELLTSGRWELAALIADRFSSGRVFLAGDAAHQLPPNRGGFGANTGIDDAHNLAWKLAAVLAGQSTPELLDTYDTERRPVAWLRHEQIFARADFKAKIETGESDVPIIDDDAMELGQLYRSAAVLGAGPDLPRARRPDQWAGQPGTRAPHLRVRAGDAELSILDEFQHGWVLLSEDQRWAAAASRAADELGIDVTFVHIGTQVAPLETEAFRTAYGVDADGATLVRPDGYIAWRTVSAPADRAKALTNALSSVSSATARSIGTRYTGGEPQPCRPTASSLDAEDGCRAVSPNETTSTWSENLSVVTDLRPRRPAHDTGCRDGGGWHDTSGYLHNAPAGVDPATVDLRAISAIDDVLAGSGQPFVGTSGTLVLPARHRTGTPRPRWPSVESGPRSSASRRACTTRSINYGFVPTLIGIARRTGVSAFVGAGANRWPQATPLVIHCRSCG